MKSLFNKEAFNEVNKRLQQLDDGDEPEWGKMTVSQMLHHCQKAFEVPLGITKGMTPNFIMRLILKVFKKSMYNDKLWKHNMPTPKAFQVTQEKDFDVEKDRLMELVSDFYTKGKNYNWPKHPAFGEFTSQQWGQMEYKHLDHHLRQFKV